MDNSGDYISRDAAIESMYKDAEAHQDHTFWTTQYEALRDIPAADVRPVVRAVWIVKEMKALFPGMEEHPVFACSECGYQIYDLLENVKERHHYCPNCGADMREES